MSKDRKRDRKRKKKLAEGKVAQKGARQTLQAMALVHEAHIRLVDIEKVHRWESRRRLSLPPRPCGGSWWKRLGADVLQNGEGSAGGPT